MKNTRLRRVLIPLFLAAGCVIGLLVIRRPFVANYLILQGEARFYAYDYDEAASYFQQAARVAPKRRQAEAYNKLGFTYRYSGQYELALQYTNRALEIDPQYAAAYENRAAINLNLGNYQTAIDDFSTAIDMMPDVALLYYERAHAYEEIGDAYNALEDYVTYLDLDTIGDEYITNSVNERIIDLRTSLQ